jgi:hypothetical protein
MLIFAVVENGHGASLRHMQQPANRLRTGQGKINKS